MKIKKNYPPQPLPHLQLAPQPQLPPEQDMFRDIDEENEITEI